VKHTLLQVSGTSKVSDTFAITLAFLLQFCAMLHRLKKKWNVSWARFTLIFITFALGGSACARLGNWLLEFILTERTVLYWIIYIPLVSLLWPICVLVISIPLGQFNFFKNYLSRIGRKLSGQRTTGNEQHIKKIAVFASGAGSNAGKIIEHFKNSNLAKVALIICNNPKAGVLNIAAENHVPVVMVNRRSFFDDTTCLDELKLHQVDLLVLAGFLWMIPGYLIQAYPGKIVNIHPALLPKYGGKGMYGANVHQAVLDAGEKESGITIHYVDKHYDNGDIIFQVKCEVLPGDTAGSLAQRVHILEHEHYPKVIEKLLTH
jgi:formyltetrahydrofolate-dependent phosphoribosylglycinamide formyltransferase